MLALLLLSLLPSPAGDIASLFTTTVTGPSAMLTCIITIIITFTIIIMTWIDIVFSPGPS